MVNYNQKFKNEVIVTINENNNNIFDSSISDNNAFSAIGQKTSGNIDNISNVGTFVIWVVKPDAVLKLEDSDIKVYDDAGSLATINVGGPSNNQLTSLVHNIAHNLKFYTNDTNITFDNFNSNDGMTQNITDLKDSSNVETFNLKTTTPSDVTCNYNTGNHSHIKTQSLNLTFDGNIKKGDTITIKRNNRDDKISTIQFDSDLIFSNLGFDNVTNAEFIYKHAEAPQPSTPKQYKIVPNLQNASIVDPEPVAGIYYLDQQHTTITLKANAGYTFENDGTLSYIIDDEGSKGTITIPATHNDTANVSLPSDIDWSNQNSFMVTMEAVAKPVAPTPKQYKLIPNLQNATIIDPKPVTDSSGNNYYLDQQHTTITLKANAGYTFENNGTLSYNIDDEGSKGTINIPANHTDTATVSLPSDIDWSNQNIFGLKMAAVSSKVIENTGGFTNIYKADYNDLLKFSNEVIVTLNGGTEKVYDPASYINNLVMLPFNVPSGENSSIVAGNKTYKTQLPTVDNNYLTVDLGKINVNEQYQNGYDYYQVKTRLMLPYTNMVEIDPIHVINKTVSIKYVVNVINGDTTINLYNDDLFFSQQTNLANKVPFIDKVNGGSQYVVINQLKTMFRNDIQQAYIIIEQPTPILNSDYYPTNEKGTLQGYKGNVKASLLNNVDMNTNDLNALQNLLQTGVNIK